VQQHFRPKKILARDLARHTHEIARLAQLVEHAPVFGGQVRRTEQRGKAHLAGTSVDVF